MAEVAIYHNPACGTSRNVLGLIRNSGVEPRVMGIDGQQSIAELGYLTLPTALASAAQSALATVR